VIPPFAYVFYVYTSQRRTKNHLFITRDNWEQAGMRVGVGEPEGDGSYPEEQTR
jgi:hypothetical protein